MNAAFDQLVASACRRFRERFGRDARWVVAAPGRVNIIGEHVDYNDGFVLPMAIDRYCVIAAADEGSGSARLYSVVADDEQTIRFNDLRSTGAADVFRKTNHWSNYPAGVIAGCLERGLKMPGLAAVIDSSVPVGGGLSSSAAIEVATATLVEAVTGTTIHPLEKALLCQKAEHDFAGVPCGIMDQFASVMSRADHFTLIDCRSQSVEHIAFTDPGTTVLITNSNVKHELSTGQYARRRAQCESAARKLRVRSLRDIGPDELEADREKLPADEYRRARHVVGEIERTKLAVDAIKRAEWTEVGKLMYESHKSLRDDYEVSCHELDILVSIAHDLGLRSGIFGSRLTGGGFGGCTVTLVETASVQHASERIARSYEAETGIEPVMIISRPAQGAHIIKSG